MCLLRLFFAFLLSKSFNHWARGRSGETEEKDRKGKVEEQEATMPPTLASREKSEKGLIAKPPSAVDHPMTLIYGQEPLSRGWRTPVSNRCSMLPALPPHSP